MWCNSFRVCVLSYIREKKEQSTQDAFLKFLVLLLQINNEGCVVLIYVRKDEVDYLRQNGLAHEVLAKTCHGKHFAVESRAVLNALKKYNDSRVPKNN